MALLFDDPTLCSAASLLHAPRPAQDGYAAGAEALVARCGLDPTEFEVRAHELSEGAPGSVLVTVANRRARASRTYLGGKEPGDWMREFEQDLRAGVFSGA